VDPIKNKNLELESRRDFLKMTAAVPLALTLGGYANFGASAQAAAPWYRTTYRWGQINLNEVDPRDFDLAWWRSYWKRSETQGMVINAGGIVAFYPSKEPRQHQAKLLNGRDLYGDIARAAHADGLKVFARMDCGSAFEPFYQAHPEWFAVNAAGQPYTTGSEADGDVLYTTCINGPYYTEYIPSILREIIAHEKPEGFTDNHWAGQSRDSMCYCVNCRSKFHAFSGQDLPTQTNWDDPVYRQWIEWSYQRRLETWDLFSNTTKAAGGPDCIWSGMLTGNFVEAANTFRDMKELCRRAEMIMLDHQGRANNGLGPPGAGLNGGFQENGDTGKRVHGLGGWDKLAPESMATYGPRKAARPIPEVRMWMIEGVAGAIQPWWHHVGGYQEDRRQFHVVEPFFRWYAGHQEYLINRLPVATVGVVYSQRNFEWYGRDHADQLALAPYDGMVQALLRARIPYLPIHADYIERDAHQFSVLVLPNLAAMSNPQVEAVRNYVGKGGSLVATDETSLYDDYGDPRPDFALADIFGVHYTGKRYGPKNPAALQHSYLRLTPDVGKDVDGPRHGDEPAASAPRHPALQGFEETNIVTFGGVLPEVKPDPGATVLLTLVPEFPVLPPEDSWMRMPRTQIPGLIVREQNGARIAFLPADIDRRYEQGNIPDHGDLLANLVRWAAKDNIPFAVKGPGLIDCYIYRQPGRLILHLVNLTSAGTWRTPVEELIPVGPLKVRVKLPEGVQGKRLLLAVSGANNAPVTHQAGWAQFEVESLLDHELAVLE
jgi:Hypothetical glycosyl hydrolase 6/TAT (twin-arginine translocation) pathway signal sequence